MAGETIEIKIGAFGIQSETLEHMEPGKVYTVSKQFGVELIHGGRATLSDGSVPDENATRTRGK